MTRKLTFGGALLTLVGAALASGPASAHHSYAMFDGSVTTTMTGAVASWDWTNPHSFLEFTDSATGQKWFLEAASPSMLSRNGMTRTILKPGDKVTVKMHPRRDNTQNGSLLSVDLAGKILMFEAQRPGGGGAGGPPGGPPVAQ